jgi:hypothetical protein
MAKIKATWSRSIRIRQYENETLELGAEAEVLDAPAEALAEQAAGLFRALAARGDALVSEREPGEPQGRPLRLPDTVAFPPGQNLAPPSGSTVEDEEVF